MAARQEEEGPDGGQARQDGQQAAGTPRPLLRAARPSTLAATRHCLGLTVPGNR